jgi:hypothetical protein
LLVSLALNPGVSRASLVAPSVHQWASKSMTPKGITENKFKWDCSSIPAATNSNGIVSVFPNATKIPPLRKRCSCMTPWRDSVVLGVLFDGTVFRSAWL